MWNQTSLLYEASPNFVEGARFPMAAVFLQISRAPPAEPQHQRPTVKLGSASALSDFGHILGRVREVSGKQSIERGLLSEFSAIEPGDRKRQGQFSEGR